MFDQFTYKCCAFIQEREVVIDYSTTITTSTATTNSAADIATSSTTNTTFINDSMMTWDNHNN